MSNETTLSDEEIEVARRQLRAGSDAAAEAAKRAGVKRHPRIPETTPNIYISAKGARFLVKAIEGYCEMLRRANEHQGEECQFFIENDLAMYEAYRDALQRLGGSDA